MSLDFAKNIQSLTTRVNEKKSKKKRSSDYISPAFEEVNKEEILATEAIKPKAIVKSNTEHETTIKSNIANITQLSPRYVSFY
jgi:hypothetical protein